MTGAASRTFSSTCFSKSTKFLRNISTRCLAVAANSAFELHVFTGSRMCGSTPGTEKGLDAALVDLEDGGFVAQTTAKPDLEVYGPLFIAPRSYRLVWGSGEAGALPAMAAGK